MCFFTKNHLDNVNQTTNILSRTEKFTFIKCLLYVPENCRTFGFKTSETFSFEAVLCCSSLILIDIFTVQGLSGALYVKIK